MEFPSIIPSESTFGKLALNFASSCAIGYLVGRQITYGLHAGLFTTLYMVAEKIATWAKTKFYDYMGWQSSIIARTVAKAFTFGVPCTAAFFLGYSYVAWISLIGINALTSQVHWVIRGQAQAIDNWNG